MERSKTQYRRLLFIHDCIKKEQYPNCRSLAEKWEVSRKTIQRDIDFIRDQLNAPIEYSAQKRGFYYSERNYQMPAILIKESELFSIFIADIVCRQYENTPLYDNLKSVFTRIEKILPGKISINTMFSDKFSILLNPNTKINTTVWEKIFSSLQKLQRVKIIYNPPWENDSITLNIEPYHVIGYQGEWYIIGHCHEREGLRTIAMSRIAKATLLNKQYQIPEDFNVSEVTGSNFGIFLNNEEYKVKVKFCPEVVPYIKERLWHPSQNIKNNKDGSIEFSLKVNNLFEIKRWVLSWGPKAKVLEPIALIYEIKNDVKKMESFYNPG